MENKGLNIAYISLLHDIGKFYQRTSTYSKLNEMQKQCTPFNGIYHTHVHSGYTSKFFQDYLKLDNALEKASSCHHLEDSDELDLIVKIADQTASSVDRNDENLDYDDAHKKTKYQYITARMASIMSVVDFGKETNYTFFDLNSIDKCSSPKSNYQLKDATTSAKEYDELFNKFIGEVNKESLLVGEPTPYKYHRMYALLYKYTVLIPSSTYETSIQTVSLFDHLKLTTAIASCLLQSKKKKFYMVEFDVSGIQKFIYEITEGSDTKGQVAKSLRGRSALVSLITNTVTYSILNEFELTQANIIFNTGGGSVILLPSLGDTVERVNRLFEIITKELYLRFQTALTLVYAIEELDNEGKKIDLELFKNEKALSLKTQLEEQKMKKYKNIIDDKFCVNEINNQKKCVLCGRNNVGVNDICNTCQSIIDISDYYTKHKSFSIIYSFGNEKLDDDLVYDLGFAKLHFVNKIDRSLYSKKEFYYLDAVNHFEAGNVKLISNLVPKSENGEVLNFEKISTSLDNEHGDQKLGILKMDVDNLGAIFAFGLKQGEDEKAVNQRSLSKYLTLSRFIELFFGYKLKNICLELSQKLQTKYENIFYINYAGGDDLVIIGPVYGIVQLAKTIHNEFQLFVQNPNITLSAGIYIQNPKKPIRFGVKLADEELEKSKKFIKNEKVEKNAITILGTTLSFDKFDDFLEDVEKYRNYLNDMNHPLSRTCFYNIMSHIDNKELEEYYSQVPIIQYILYRSMDEKYEELRKEVSYRLTSIKEAGLLQETILFMKLVILFTREV